ncbi:hypothetical protein [Kribbella amoyensis]|uniref:hypothetical protein n=1 Tax=Kribbella amoyensis TaxID=996641 RepID=UPI0011A4C70C|nr:hypothetical protein [Kribbella amoyensis]
MKLKVDLGGEPSGRVDVTLGYYVSGAVTIEPGTCDATCELTVPLRIGDWDHPQSGSLLLSAKLTTASGAISHGGGYLSFVAPTQIYELRHLRDGEVFSDGVADSSATFRVTVINDPGEAVAELRLIELATGATRLTASAPFSSSRGLARDALLDLDVTDLTDGLYRVETRARGVDGYYGSGQVTQLRVNHANQAGFDLGDERPAVVGWAGLSANLLVQGPLLSGSKPAAVRLTVDGAERAVLVLPGVWMPNNWQQPTAKQQVSVYMQGDDLTLGTHQVKLELFDTAGRIIGRPTTRTVLVSDFKATVVAPTLVVGRRSVVTLNGDAPTGHLLTQCHAELAAPQPIDSTGLGAFCTTPAATLRTTAPVTPRASGRSSLGLYLNADGYSKLFERPVTVHAARRATTTAPAVPYGQRGTAKVTVQDSHRIGAWTAAPAGVTVTLQRQAVGSTAWATVGSVKTMTGGIASIPFTSGANGNFRAVLASSVPGETVITPTVAAVSVATVVWRSVPTSVIRGKATTYEVAAAPYEAGAVAHLQARKPGSTVWTTVRSVAVPSSTVTRIAYSFPTAGTWSIRVLRAATKQHAAGLSGAATVKVK